MTLESLAERFSAEAVSSVYRPLKSFLLKLADLYHEKMSCLRCFNEEKGLLYLTVGQKVLHSEKMTLLQLIW